MPTTPRKRRPALRRAVQRFPFFPGVRNGELRVYHVKITSNGHGYVTVGATTPEGKQIRGTREPFQDAPLAASRYLSELIEKVGRDDRDH